MKNTEAPKNTKKTSRNFSPKLSNLEVSLSYEGLSLKAKKQKSLEELKRQYAR